MLGQFEAEVEVEATTHRLPILVAQGNGPALFGRNWLHAVRLNWNRILNTSQALPTKLQPYKALFEGRLGTIKAPKVHFHLNPDAVPRFHRARHIPYALRPKVKKEINRLVSLGIISRIQRNDWGTPIVVVPKPNGTIRICGDYKVTINPQMLVDPYEFPRPEDLFATLEGGVLFSKLDLSQAYNQLELDEESKKLCALNTPYGLFKVNRVPFGPASAPAKFQRVMDDMFRDLSYVKCYLDDILITGRTEEEHWKRLCEVLRSLLVSGAQLDLAKCMFAVPELPFLGHIISKDGLKTAPSKVQAVLEAQRPTDVTLLKSFLGLVNYYGRFIPRLAHSAAPLNILTQKGVHWKWEKTQEEAWQSLKKRFGVGRSPLPLQS